MEKRKTFKRNGKTCEYKDMTAIEIPRTAEFGWHERNGGLVFHPSDSELQRRCDYYYEMTTRRNSSHSKPKPHR